MGAMNILAVIWCVMFYVSVQGAKWGEWKTITQCNARPCGCPGYDKATCKTGKVVQMRICITDGWSTCIGDGGAVRVKKGCKNVGICPGWSEWIPKKSDKCKCNDGESNGTMAAERHCNNPAPIHDDVLCQTENKQPGICEDDDDKHCVCADTTVAVAVTTESVTESIPETTDEIIYANDSRCCDDYTYPNGNELLLQSINQSTTTTAAPVTTMKPKYVYDYGEGFDFDYNNENEEELCQNLCSNNDTITNDTITTADPFTISTDAANSSDEDD